MKKLCLLTFSIVTFSNLHSQEVISTQGDSYSNGTGSIDFTIGEVVIDTGTDGTYDITQGFQQTNWNFVGLEDHLPTYEAIIFPNPTVDILNIKASVYQGVYYILYDAQGKVVLNEKLNGEQTQLNVLEMNSGSYSLVLLNQDQQKLKTFKLIKR